MVDLFDLGAIVTRNIALGYSPILYAERSESVDPCDSGWQFTTGGDDISNPDNAEIWKLSELIELDGTIIPFLSMPIGTKMLRQAKESVWYPILKNE